MTGSSGLIGKALRPQLEKLGHTVAGCDLRTKAEEERFDLRDSRRVRDAVWQSDGVVHLGAVSRVIWGEQNPVLCESVNIGGMKNLAMAVLESRRKPWLLLASSREVYGNSPCKNSNGTFQINPVNIYAKTKATSELIVADLRTLGVATAVLRLSNVFGTTDDHADRVVPAFARAAAINGILKVEGCDNFFDFNHVNDTVDAIVKTIEILNTGVADLPPLDIVTGRATSLLYLAEMALVTGEGKITVAPSRGVGAEQFQGDPRIAKRILGWRTHESLEESVARLVKDFQGLLSHD
ncbi:MAG: NAD(P)-dependent oxidoreductase [Candidatus Dadabacteria bacterium]|nr:NAD(P)-dependent oxidoreductase [Candidatus Dadabacteria bacterium]